MKRILLLHPITYAMLPMEIDDTTATLVVIYFDHEQKEPYKFLPSANRLRLVNDATDEVQEIWTVNGMAW